MGSNFHYSIDLNKDQNHHHDEQPLIYYPLGSSFSPLDHNHHHKVPSNSSTSSSSLSSYIPFLINSQEDQHVAYNNTYQTANLLHLSQTLKEKMLNGGSTYDHMVPKKETRLKLTTRGKNHHQDQTGFNHQNTTKQDSDSNKIKNTVFNNKHYIDHTNNNNKSDHYGYNNGEIRVCFDCNTTKTPLWRSGPRGPKSLCNACGIRQRKARQAAMVAAVADHEMVTTRLQQLPLKKKLQNNKKRLNDGGDKHTLSTPVVAKAKKYKLKEEEEEEEEVVIFAGDYEISKSTTSSNSSSSSNTLLCFDDLRNIMSQNSAFQQVFSQDEKEAAILLMALSYGVVHV
ncbi:unnamed protein product [Cochlearia groenlandica]